MLKTVARLSVPTKNLPRYGIPVLIETEAFLIHSLSVVVCLISKKTVSAYMLPATDIKIGLLVLIVVRAFMDFERAFGVGYETQWMATGFCLTMNKGRSRCLGPMTMITCRSKFALLLIP